MFNLFSSAFKLATLFLFALLIPHVFLGCSEKEAEIRCSHEQLVEVCNLTKLYAEEAETKCSEKYSAEVCLAAQNKSYDWDLGRLHRRAELICSCEAGCELDDACAVLNNPDIASRFVLSLTPNGRRCTSELSLVGGWTEESVSMIDTVPMVRKEDGTLEATCGLTPKISGVRFAVNLFTQYVFDYYSDATDQSPDTIWPGDASQSNPPGLVLATCGDQQAKLFRFVDDQLKLKLSSSETPLSIKAKPVDVRFDRRSANRASPVSVAVVVDLGESIAPSSDCCYFQETKTQSGAHQMCMWENISDYYGERLVALSNELTKYLREEDELVVYFVNEFGLFVNEKSPLAQGDVDLLGGDLDAAIAPLAVAMFRLAAVGVTAAYLGEFTLDCTHGFDPCGRTPLWTGVKRAVDVLTDHATTETRHVVVISDGPDTCGPDSPYHIESTDCAISKDLKIIGYQTILDQIQAVPHEERIPISFIQLQSPGYGSSDPAQMEIACLTGGTYQWIQRDGVSDATFEAAMNDAIRRIRGTLRGTWYLDVEFEEVQTEWTQGNIVELDGTIQLHTDEGAVGMEQTLSQGAQAPRKVMMRTSCTQDSQCPGGSDSDCVQSCVPQGNACATPGFEPWLSKEGCCQGLSCTEPRQCLTPSPAATSSF